MIDMISEGNLELMRSVKTFDPDRGFRLATLVEQCFIVSERICL